jgi:hypothetical protein
MAIVNKDGDMVAPAKDKADRALNGLIKDARQQIERRFETDGDCERSRAFAQTKLAPLARAAWELGNPIDTGKIIEQIAKEKL